MGTTIIAEITPPIMTIWSVDPTIDLPCGCGVGVTSVKNVFAEKFICAFEGAEYVSAALKSANSKLNPIMIRGGVNLFIDS